MILRPKHIVFFLIALLFCIININSQDNTITLKSLPTGSEGNTKYTDNSVIYIDNSGVASYRNTGQFDDWSVSSTTINHQGTLDKTFEILIGAMATVNTNEGKEFGSILTKGGIDRASNGNLGVRSGNGEGNGIDVNEGMYFGLDLSQIDDSASIQITKVYVNFAGLTDESGIIVNLMNPSKRVTFGTSIGVDIPINDNNENVIDISSFNLYIAGREKSDAMLSIFNNSTNVNSFRITGIDLKILDNNLDASKVSNLAHPRLLLKKGEESLIQNLIDGSDEFKALHNYIVQKSDEYLTSPKLVKPDTDRILSFSREVIFQTFYLSYAYRITKDSKYLVKGEEILNTISDFDDWHDYTLDTAGLCFAAAIGYDWLFDDLKSTTKQKVREAIVNFALKREKYKGFWDTNSNWNQVGIGGFGFGAIAILGDGTSQMDDEASFYLNQILVKNPKSMNTYSNGNYQEGAMYWSYGTTYEVMLLSTLEGIYGENHEGISRLTNTPGFLESAEFMQYLTGPTSLYFNYMDSTEKRTPLPAKFWMAKKINKPSILIEEIKLLKNGSYFDTNVNETRFLPITMVYAKDILLDNLSEPQSKIWKGYGSQPLALVRTDWKGSTGKYFGVKAGTPTYSHGQMDGGTFVYDSQGLRWASDFGKFDYAASNNYLENLDPPLTSFDFSQNSPRWDIFRVNNISHNTISIKKTSENSWQYHKADGFATMDEVYDTDAKRGAKINLKSIVGLNNELDEIYRSVYLVDETYLEIKDEVKNDNEAVDLYWNIATTAIVSQINSNTLKLKQGGKTVFLEVSSSNTEVAFTLASNRSTDPVTYNSNSTHERKNDNAVMIGFTATIPANSNVTFITTLKDGEEVAPSSSIENNEILLELPEPNNGLEGNSKYSDQSNFYINSSGEISISGFSTSYAWKVYGDTDITDATDNSFTFSWDAMGATNITEGTDYGALLTPAGIDRASRGDLGIRGASNGISPNEGYRVGFDVKELPKNVLLQLVKVGLDFIGGSDKGVIVNRHDTNKRTTFGANGTDADVNLSKGFVNVESLDIVIAGGDENKDLASIFNTSESGTFRINKFVFKIKNSTLSTDKNETLNKNILLYPNPFKETIRISQNNLNPQNITAKIYNILGVKIYENTIKNGVKIDLSSLKKGVYLLEIIIDNKITRKKIIKN